MDTPTSSSPRALPSDDGAPGKRRGRRWAYLCVVGLLSLLPAVWASDASFVGDPPQLIGNAMRANLTGNWAATGLIGTLGRPYGPLPTWLYQVGLLCTDDLVTIVRVRAVLCAAITLGASAWIARTAGFPFVWLLGVAVSPYLLLYDRGLWDNTFNIPLAALTAALALHVVVRRTLWPLPLLLLAGGAMLMVHLMSLATVAAAAVFVAAGAGPAFRAATRRERFGVGVACGVVAVLGYQVAASYLSELCGPRVYVPSPSPAANSWWFAFLSPRLLTSVWMEFLFPRGYLDGGPLPGLFAVARAITTVQFALAAFGCALTAYGLLARPKDADGNGSVAAGRLGTLIVLAQVPLNGLTHTYGNPHYYNATWIAPALLVGVALRGLGKWHAVAGRTVGGTAAAALATCSVLIGLRVHATGGTRPSPARPGDTPYDVWTGNYGPTLGNQIAVVRAARRLGPATPRFPDSDYTLVPMSLDALFALHGGQGAPGDPAAAPVEIRYRNKTDPWDGRIAVFAGPDPRPQP